MMPVRQQKKEFNLSKKNFIRLGAHQVAKLQHMVENTRQRLLDLKHSQKTVDRSYHSLQVGFVFLVLVSILLLG